MTLTKPLIIYSIIAILLGTTVWISTLMYASYHLGVVADTMNDWQLQQRIPSEQEWNDTYVQVNRALQFDTSNPDYLEKRAELYLWKSLLSTNTQQEREKAISSAEESYRQLISLKPSWPNYWGGLIQAKFALWEFDGEMYSAIQNAAHYGPWFKNNQRTILRVGYQGWPFLNEETRQVVTETLDRAFKIQPTETIRLALDDGFIQYLMLSMEADMSLMQRYKRELQNREKKLGK